jgi:hypothetical protein
MSPLDSTWTRYAEPLSVAIDTWMMASDCAVIS